MLDKNFIAKKFENSINFYDDNAIIQELMAKKLISLIEKKKFKNILEIGSYSGLLTKKAVEKFDFDNYLALDIVDSFDKIKNLSPKITFEKNDVEEFNTNQKFDLIIANASLQWCLDFEHTIKKLKSYLNKGGIIAVSIFALDNFYEIRDSFNVSLKYKTIDEIEKVFSENVKIIQESHTLQFKNSKDLLKHIKLTGVNAISKENLSVVQIKNALKILEEKYQNKLTYKPVYIID